MPKRGRPRKSVAQPRSTITRAQLVLCEYNQARRAGEKHSSAVASVVAALLNSESRVSETEVKRILKIYQPAGASESFDISEMSEAEVEQELEPYRSIKLRDIGSFKPPVVNLNQMKSGFALTVGPRPQYPRINAKSPKHKSPPA